MVTSRSEPAYDVCVIGAGPAGLSAAGTAADAGCRVALVDAGARAGGQYWRHAESARPPQGLRRPAERLAAHTAAGRVEVFRRHHVWTVEAGERFGVLALDRAADPPRERRIEATALVLAPGAYDRQIPFPGWDLPGVFTAGGAQALLKEHHVVVGRRVLVAGTGPFLLPVAAGLADAGATVVGVHEANGLGRWLHRQPLLATGRNLDRLGELLGYSTALLRHRVPYHPRSTIVAAHGDREVEGATVARLDRNGRVVTGTERGIPVDAVAVGWGFTPQLELALALGCATRVDNDGSLVAVVDDQQESSVRGVWVAGEATGVGGALLSAVEGELAGAAAAGRVRSDDRRSRAKPLVRRRSALRAFAAAMHDAHPVPTGWVDNLTDDTLVCRCEEVPVGRLRHAVVELGADDSRTAKLFTRAGMGWCQGRVCGYPTSWLVAAWTGRRPDPAGTSERPLATPVPLRMLADEPATDPPDRRTPLETGDR